MYNKLFPQILDSSIWLEPHPTRIVWITLLAAMDEDGYAHFAAIENLANRARVTVEECQNAVVTLCNADPNSSNQDNEGRRIERVPGGFMVLNAKHYQALANRQMQRERTKQRVHNYRLRKKQETGNGDVTLPPVTEKLPGVNPEDAGEDGSALEGGVEGEPKWTIENAMRWLSIAKGNGADYTEQETRSAFLALSANGFKWGRNPITDFPSAIERQIQTDRDRKIGNGNGNGKLHWREREDITKAIAARMDDLNYCHNEQERNILRSQIKELEAKLK